MKIVELCNLYALIYEKKLMPTKKKFFSPQKSWSYAFCMPEFIKKIDAKTKKIIFYEKKSFFLVDLGKQFA